MIDFLITLIIILVVFAIVSYVINTFVPLDPALKNLVMLILGAILLVWLLACLAGYAPVTPLWRRHP